jgi:hypothetical protein
MTTEAKASEAVRTTSDPDEIPAMAALAKTRLEKIYFGRSGVADGGSFKMWRELGDDAIIFGIDIIPECREEVEAMGINCRARIGSQADPEFLASAVCRNGHRYR